ncbi:hypothetical protein ACWGH2_43955 [Streptomyces sp. NPDC054871]
MASPLTHPLIGPACLTDPAADLDVLVEGVSITRDIAATELLSRRSKSYDG